MPSDAKNPKYANSTKAVTFVANGAAPRTLDAKHKRLLEKQESLLKIIREQSTRGMPSPISKANAAEIAKQVGILTPSGKLSSSYKK
ncbi:hypothetical protein [Pseudoduganella sp. OTU4001]|uniref:hypothetical protein n=1 Tax=Pseudoduganella sp. OTU4001 TaxID=3043854 RepID=UPI00313E90CB